MDSEVPQVQQSTTAKPPLTPTSSNSAPQVRSRITVVCAECKRLKLKCDRRNPCASCVKRDTVSRCVYSPAAAEKVDLHSLNNRLIQVEATLAQITAGQFVSSYPPSAVQPPQPPPPSLPSAQHSIFLQAAAGSCLTFSLEDLAAVWLDQLDLGVSLCPDSTHVQVKTEPSSKSGLLSSPAQSQPLPPMTVYYPDSTSPRPGLSQALLDLLPPSVSSQHSTVTSPYSLQNLLHIAENSVVHSYPSLNWNYIRSRAIKMVSASVDAKQAMAVKIFFGQSVSTNQSSAESTSEDCIPFFAVVCAALAIGCSNDDPNLSDPEIVPSFTRKSKPKKHAPATAGQYSPPDPWYWYALSVQALGVYEGASAGNKVSEYNLDYLIACLLQVIFLVKDPGARSSSGTDGPVFPLVGKMVNIARQIGLTRDPDEADDSMSVPQQKKHTSADTPKPTLFESEMRRRIWWDIVYYDLLVSDVMGHPPLIPEKSFSTAFPATDVDDKTFGPASTHVPLPRMDETTGYMKDGLQYFEIKCRLSQLIRTIKKRMTCPEPTFPGLGHSTQSAGIYTIDQAAFMESEVKSWLAQLPPCFKFESSPNNVDIVLGVQRCELAITTHRLILKIYLPFLKTASPPPYQAIVGTVNAAHFIIQASKLFSKHCLAPRSPRDRKAPSPAMFDFYPLPRILFDAAIICAHAVIKHPNEIWATTASDDFYAALEILKDGTFWRTSSLGARYDVPQDDAIRVLDTIWSKLHQPSSSVPHKRKIDDVEKATNLSDVPPGSYQVNGNGTEMITLSPHPEPESSAAARQQHTGSAATSSKGNGHDKKQKKSYPAVGVRVRPGKTGLRPMIATTALSAHSTLYAPSTDSTARLTHRNDGDSPSSAPGSVPRSRSSSISQDSLGKSQHFSPPLPPSMSSNGREGERGSEIPEHGFAEPVMVYEYHQPMLGGNDPPPSDYSDPLSPYAADGHVSTASSPYATSCGTNLLQTPNLQNSYFTSSLAYAHEPPRNIDSEHMHHVPMQSVDSVYHKPHGSFQTPTGQLPYPMTGAWPMSQSHDEYWQPAEYKYYL